MQEYQKYNELNAQRDGRQIEALLLAKKPMLSNLFALHNRAPLLPQIYPRLIFQADRCAAMSSGSKAGPAKAPMPSRGSTGGAMGVPPRALS